MSKSAQKFEISATCSPLQYHEYLKHLSSDCCGIAGLLVPFGGVQTFLRFVSCLVQILPPLVEWYLGTGPPIGMRAEQRPHKPVWDLASRLSSDKFFPRKADTSRLLYKCLHDGIQDSMHVCVIPLYKGRKDETSVSCVSQQHVDSFLTHLFPFLVLYPGIRRCSSWIGRIRLGIAKDMAAGMRSLYAHGMQHRHLSSNAVLLTGDFRAKVSRTIGMLPLTSMIVCEGLRCSTRRRKDRDQSKQ